MKAIYLVQSPSSRENKMSVINLNNSLTETHQVRTNTNCTTCDLTRETTREWLRPNADLGTATLTSKSAIPGVKNSTVLETCVCNEVHVYQPSLLLAHHAVCVSYAKTDEPVRQQQRQHFTCAICMSALIRLYTRLLGMRLQRNGMLTLKYGSSWFKQFICPTRKVLTTIDFKAENRNSQWQNVTPKSHLPSVLRFSLRLNITFHDSKSQRYLQDSLLQCHHMQQTSPQRSFQNLSSFLRQYRHHDLKKMYVRHCY